MSGMMYNSVANYFYLLLKKIYLQTEMSDRDVFDVHVLAGTSYYPQG